MKFAHLFHIFSVLALTGCSKHRTPSAELVNQEAAWPAGLPVNPLTWRAITSTADNRMSTMATLFGNEPAINQVRETQEGDYPSGSELALVTWNERDDPHWFGAKIPGQIRSIEFVKFGGLPEKSHLYTYQRFEGTPLKIITDSNTETSQLRIRQILNLQPSVMP
jgi:hypothetical protein